MHPRDLQVIGQELAVKWDDGTESFISLRTLREHCPCAGCQGERDVMGNLHRAPKAPLTDASTRLKSVTGVGGYALRPVWEDGHHTGLFSYDYLKALADQAEGGSPGAP